MKLFSSSTVFLILLGVFVTFCLFTHVKSRYAEGLTEGEGDEAGISSGDIQLEHQIINDSIARPDYEDSDCFYDPKDPKTKNCKEPFFMREAANKVEGFSNNDPAMCSGGKSAYGCCPIDNSPMSDNVGTNCKYNINTKERDFTTGSGVPATGNNFQCSTTKSIYGCCPGDRKPMTDITGSNCFGGNTGGRGMTGGTGNTGGTGMTGGTGNTGGTGMTGGTGNTGGLSPSTNLSCPNQMGAASTSNASTNNSLSSIGAMISNFSAGTSTYPSKLPQSCAGTIYGCCPDAVTARNADGSSCPASSAAQAQTSGLTAVQANDMQSGIMAANTNTVLIPPPVGNVAANACACPAPPPCPACARCPEPAFDCKKVPNYSRSDNERILPQPVLNDFSTFGI